MAKISEPGVDRDSAQIFCLPSGRVHQGQTCNSHSPTYLGRRKNFTGQSFWARGYDVSTVGRDEAVVRQYIRDQEKEDQRLDPLTLWRGE